MQKNIVGSVYSGAKIEGINVTFSETDAIINGINVPRLNVDEIETVRALHDAWKYVLNNPDKSIDLDYICKINEIAARSDALIPGAMRTANVYISGTAVPPVPDQATVKAELAVQPIGGVIICCTVA